MQTSKILAEILPAASDTVLMYYNLTGDGAYGNLFFVNQSSDSDRVRVAITPTDVLPNPASYLLYDTVVPPNHTVVLQEIALAQFERLYVFSANGTTSFVYTGIEYQPNPVAPPTPGPIVPAGANGSTITWISYNFGAKVNQDNTAFTHLAPPVLNTNYNTMIFPWPVWPGYAGINDLGNMNFQVGNDVGSIGPDWENIVIGGAVDSQNNVYVGWTVRDMDSTIALILFKYDSNNQLQFNREIKLSQSILLPSGYVTSKVYLTVTDQNRLYAMLSVIPVSVSPIYSSIHFMEIDRTTGNVLSHNDISLPPNAVLLPGPKNAATDSLGCIYIAGQYQATLDQTDPSALIIAKYNVNGSMAWLKQIPNDVGYHNFANGIAVTTDSGTEYLYISGSAVRQSDGRPFNLLAKLDLNGNAIWANRYGVSNTTTQVTSLNYVSADPLSGYVVVTGRTQNSAVALWINQSTGNIEHGWDFQGNPDPTLAMEDLGLVNDDRGYTYFTFLQACDTTLNPLSITAKFRQDQDFTQASYTASFSGETVVIQPSRIPAGYFISKNMLSWTTSGFSANLDLFNVASNTTATYMSYDSLGGGAVTQTQQT